LWIQAVVTNLANTDEQIDTAMAIPCRDPVLFFLTLPLAVRCREEGGKDY